jgi:hypothetical protein
MNNKGIGTIEIILILVVLIGLVIIFRNQLFQLIATIFATIASDSNQILH